MKKSGRAALLLSHTPGPWKVTPENVGKHRVPTYYVDSEAHGTICSTLRMRNWCPNDRDKSDAERLANARLIAAAPELLVKVALYADEEAMRIKELENMDDPPEDVADMIGHHKHLLADLDALLLKARGRKS